MTESATVRLSVSRRHENVPPAELGQLCVACGERALRIARSLVWDQAEAEDIVQEALARACESGGAVRQSGALHAWFYRVVVNLCLRSLRRRRLRYLAHARWLREASPTPAVTADQAIDVERTREAVADGLRRLTARQQAVLVLRYGHDLSIAEIADLVGTGTETVKTHLSRGARRLRPALRRLLGDCS
jgi:RNA polymerase sigma factor (sigma-70 family)